MLCTICAGIFRGERPPLWAPAPEIKHEYGSRDWTKERDIERESLRILHYDISQVANGAVWGCTICDVIWRHFFRDKTAKEHQSNPAFLRNNMIHTYMGSGTHYRIMKPSRWKRDDYGPDALDIQIGLNSPMDRDIPEHKEITLDPTEDEPAVDLFNLPKPDVSIYGPRTFRTVQSWTSNCKQNHQACNEGSVSSTWYPTRLLDLKYFAPDDPGKQQEAIVQLFRTGHLPADCKLIETSQAPITGSYMTLSHRWDVHGKLCTTIVSNIEQRMQRILASELPKVFEEAIQLTRCLGVRYLWIDSLCIVQGDGGDFESEAMTMGNVYAHSMLNIEATAGNSSLLQPRNPRIIAPCVVRSHWKGIKSIRYVVSDFRYWDSRIHRSVCNTRAWITQERWLSPRVLHFTFDQLIWECCELEAGETYPQGLPKEIKSQSSTGFKKLGCGTASKKISGKINPNDYNRVLADWGDVLLTYTRAELTNSSDRLVAVAGLAAKFSKILDDEWLAGLWRKNLPGELLWRVDKTRRSNKPPDPVDIVAEFGLGINRTHRVHLSERLKGSLYEAPSWSWASVLGDIVPGYSMPDGSEDSMIDILDVKLIALDPSVPLGRFIGGTLKLRGALYPMAMDPPDWTPEAAKKDYMLRPPTIYISGLDMADFQDPMNLGLAEQMRDLYLKTGTPMPKMHTHVVHLRADEPIDYADLARSCFLPVRYHTLHKPGSQYHGNTLVCGLALMPTGERGEYARLGTVDFGGDNVHLFIDGVKVQRAGEEALGLKAHPPTQDAILYVENEVGVFTIV